MSLARFLQSFGEIDRKDATLCFVEKMGLVFVMLLAGRSDTGIPPAEMEKTWNTAYMYICP